MATLVEILITEDCPNDDAAIHLVGMAAECIGVAPRLRLTEVADLDQAAQQGFTGSPTIRVNGRDIAPPGSSPSGMGNRRAGSEGLETSWTTQHRLGRKSA